ncbi:MAG: hypothetical protein H6865_08015 [Rhodospirillales bacterium]|nr:hypothetical protein [Alphaproteobacteria bacterium]MCB9987561.1 hypothetical protein [Rhodospirillales bacterium]USO07718.1 MAG: hypothetical protein H6866_00335 [Rhodospirillales bacterium]
MPVKQPSAADAFRASVAPEYNALLALSRALQDKVPPGTGWNNSVHGRLAHCLNGALGNVQIAQNIEGLRLTESSTESYLMRIEGAETQVEPALRPGPHLRALKSKLADFLSNAAVLSV